MAPVMELWSTTLNSTPIWLAFPWGAVCVKHTSSGALRMLIDRTTNRISILLQIASHHDLRRRHKCITISKRPLTDYMSKIATKQWLMAEIWLKLVTQCRIHDQARILWKNWIRIFSFGSIRIYEYCEYYSTPCFIKQSSVLLTLIEKSLSHLMDFGINTILPMNDTPR